MKLYSHILVPIDLLPESKKIIKKALALAKAFDSKITLLHVIEPSPASEHIFVNQDEYHAQAETDAREELKKYHELIDIPTREQLVVFGVPSDEILLVAKEHHCDLILMGSHGREGWYRLIGSTATSVINHAHCDVLLERFER